MNSLGKQLLGYLPNFHIVGSLMFLPPPNPVLRGIAIDGSAFDTTSFTVCAFLLPLCVPTRHLYFNFGNRIRQSGGGDRWSMTNPDLVADLGMALRLQAIPFLSRVTSLSDFVETAKTYSHSNPHTLRAMAYALARLRRIAEAIEVLSKLEKQLDQSIGWQVALAGEIGQLKSQLMKNPAQALHQLQAWEHDTAKNLGFNNDSASISNERN